MMQPSSSRNPLDLPNIPILGQQPAAAAGPSPIPVPVVAAYGGGQTIEQAEASALAQVGAAGVNLIESPEVVFLPALCLIQMPEDAQESVLGALGITTPSHPLWGHNLRCLVAMASSDDPETWVGSTIGWIQAVIAPGAPPFGGLMVRATYRAPTQEEARDRAEERMDLILRRVCAERGMPQPEKIMRVTATAGLDADDLARNVTAASALVLAGFRLEPWS